MMLYAYYLAGSLHTFHPNGKQLSMLLAAHMEDFRTETAIQISSRGVTW